MTLKNYDRRAVLAGLTVAPLATIGFTTSAQAAPWIRLSKGGSGTNRFKEDTDGHGGIWAVCYNVTHKGAPVTGAKKCKLIFASGPDQDATVRLDAKGNGETGEYENNRGSIIGVMVCV